MRILSSKKFEVHIDKFNLPNGVVVESPYVLHRGSVLIVPFLDRETVILLHQYRYIIGKWLYEFPAGTIEEGEKPEDTAKRELLEETGYRSENLKLVGQIYPAPGSSTEKMYIFLARDLIEEKPNREEEEIIEVLKLKLTDVIELAKSGQIEDAKTLATLFYLTHMQL